jgi:hypothetical protein
VIDQIAGRIGNAVQRIVGRVRVEFDFEHPSDEVAMNVPLGVNVTLRCSASP